jgi:hypothetical protein
VLAEGTITINNGQARLSNTIARAQGAELVVNGGLDLAQGTLDARLTLLGSGGAGAPANTRPEVLISLKGPVDAPKRSIDVAALSSWLALRAVEQQSKKLDVLEGREPPAAPAPSSAPGAAPGRNEGAALTVPLPEATGTDSPTAKATHTEEASPPRPARAPIVPKPKPEPKPAASTADQVQPLPPPVDIRPVPTPRPPRPAATTQGAARQPPKPPTPPAPRSLSEILFGH